MLRLRVGPDPIRDWVIVDERNGALVDTREEMVRLARDILMEAEIHDRTKTGEL